MTSPKKTSKLEAMKEKVADKVEKQHNPLAKKVHIPVHPSEHSAPATLHAQKTMQNSSEAVILVSGAGGETSGPGGIHATLAEKLARECSVPTLRLDYKERASKEHCIPDILASLDYLKDHYSCRKFAICGWSYAAIPVLSAAVQDERIAGVALIASEASDSAEVGKLAPRPLLLIHGTEDKTLKHSASKSMHDAYGEKGDKTIKLFEGDDHHLSSHAQEAETLVYDFACRVLARSPRG